MPRTYILYDSRACVAQGTGDASVFVACDSDEEARSYCGDYGVMACYSYDVDANNNLINEKWEWDWHPKSKRKK